jgi:hypothetical protein
MQAEKKSSCNGGAEVSYTTIDGTRTTKSSESQFFLKER